MTNQSITIGETAYLRTDLETMTREQLRGIARQAHKERSSNVSLTWLGSAAKASDLVAFILGDEASDQFGFGHVQPTPQAQPTKSDSLAATLADALKGYLPNGTVNRDEVQAIVSESTDEVETNLLNYVDRKSDELSAKLADEFEELIQKQSVRRVVIENTLTGTTTDVGVQHERFEALLKRVQIAREAARLGKFLNIWIVGPAGSGKTTACENVAKALGMNFEFNGALDSEHKLLGFVDAHGRIVSRPFRKAWEHGGIYLFDEVDASLPGACLALNAALANGYCDFPDAKLDRNSDCVILASGNVWNGPTEEYVGRYRPDAAFSNRFIKFRFDYDEKLERALAGNDKWVDYVQTVRRNVRAKGVKIVVSPRASIFGALLLAGGVSWEETVEETLRQGLAQQTWDSISNLN